MSTLTWEDVLKRDDIVGGDIETQGDGDVYRGPIESIGYNGKMIAIKSSWMAKKEGGAAAWKNWHITSMNISKEIIPNDIGDGRIQFHMPMMGLGVIFPKGGSKLDPEKVEGLEV